MHQVGVWLRVGVSLVPEPRGGEAVERGPGALQPAVDRPAGGRRVGGRGRAVLDEATRLGDGVAEVRDSGSGAVALVQQVRGLGERSDAGQRVAGPQIVLESGRDESRNGGVQPEGRARQLGGEGVRVHAVDAPAGDLVAQELGSWDPSWLSIRLGRAVVDPAPLDGHLPQPVQLRLDGRQVVTDQQPRQPPGDAVDRGQQEVPGAHRHVRDPHVEEGVRGRPLAVGFQQPLYALDVVVQRGLDGVVKQVRDEPRLGVVGAGRLPLAGPAVEVHLARRDRYVVAVPASVGRSVASVGPSVAVTSSSGGSSTDAVDRHVAAVPVHGQRLPGDRQLGRHQPLVDASHRADVDVPEVQRLGTRRTLPVCGARLAVPGRLTPHLRPEQPHEHRPELVVGQCDVRQPRARRRNVDRLRPGRRDVVGVRGEQPTAAGGQSPLRPAVVDGSHQRHRVVPEGRRVGVEFDCQPLGSPRLPPVSAHLPAAVAQLADRPGQRVRGVSGVLDREQPLGLGVGDEQQPEERDQRHPAGPV